MAFRVGQKVVCVNDTPTGEGIILKDHIDGGYTEIVGNLDGLKKGETYTIRGLTMSWTTGGLALYLEEIRRVPIEHRREAPYRADRFRPVVEKSTDAGMAILREILDRETIKDRDPVRQR